MSKGPCITVNGSSVCPFSMRFKKSVRAPDLESFPEVVRGNVFRGTSSMKQSIPSSVRISPCNRFTRFIRLASFVSRHSRTNTATFSPLGLDTEKADASPVLSPGCCSAKNSISWGQILRPFKIIKSFSRPVITMLSLMR